MSPIFCCNADDSFLTSNGWNQDDFRYLPFDAAEQGLFGSHIEDGLSFGFSDTVDPTFLSPSGPIDEQMEHVLPVRSIPDPTTKDLLACSRGQGLFSNQNENSMTHASTARTDWTGIYESPNKHGGALSPTAGFEEQNMTTNVDEGIGSEKTISPLPNLVWAQTSQSRNDASGQGLRSMPPSQRDCLPIEPRNYAYGWHCSICKQQFKRRDYIKPHVERKHPEWYGSLYSISNTTSEQSVAPPAHLPSARNVFMSFSEPENPTFGFFQSDMAFSGTVQRPTRGLLIVLSRMIRIS